MHGAACRQTCWRCRQSQGGCTCTTWQGRGRTACSASWRATGELGAGGGSIGQGYQGPPMSYGRVGEDQGWWRPRAEGARAMGGGKDLDCPAALPCYCLQLNFAPCTCNTPSIVVATFWGDRLLQRFGMWHACNSLGVDMPATVGWLVCMQTCQRSLKHAAYITYPLVQVLSIGYLIGCQLHLLPIVTPQHCR